MSNLWFEPQAGSILKKRSDNEGEDQDDGDDDQTAFEEGVGWGGVIMDVFEVVVVGEV